MRPQTIIKLANFTRRFSRYENPIGYRLCRNLLKLVYKRGSQSGFDAVMPYDKGLININTGNMHEYEILFFHSTEPAIINLIKRIVKPGNVCIDIGANIGGITLVMAHAVGDSGKVIAVEPHPVISSRLQKNIDLNRLENCLLIQAAVSDKDGVATLYCTAGGDFHQGWSSLMPSAVIPNQINVTLVRGNTISEKIGKGPLTFIKIDVEGHDFIVLKELEEAISKYHPHIVLEYSRRRWDEHGNTLEDALQFLEKIRYEVYFIKNDLVFPSNGRFPDSCDLFCVPKSIG